MEASILDLRYKMKDILRSLDRNEIVKIYYHGKLKGTINPCKKENRCKGKIKESEFFGMLCDEKTSVDETMNRLRGGRHAL